MIRIEPEPGELIENQYRLIEQLGTGGFAKVWRAQDQEANRKVAVKIPRKKPQDSGQIKQHFNREIDALQAINRAGNHPNIVSAHDGKLSDNGTFLVLDYLNGSLLDRAVDRGRIKPGEKSVFEIGGQICDAMSFLHQNDILYLDLKPANILIGENDNPVLIDFNTAAVGKTHDETLFYDDAYKPIEQTPGTGHDLPIGKPADVYACGHVLAYLLTGETHGQDDRKSNTLDLHREGISDGLSNLLRRATSRYPNSRFNSCQGLSRALKNVQDGYNPNATLEHLESGKDFSIVSGEVFGRDSSQADVVVRTNDEYISPRQARIEAYGTGWDLRDLSTNGTYVNIDGSWELALSDEGYQKQREAGTLPDNSNQPPTRRIELTDGAKIRPVSPDYEVTFRFKIGP